MTRTALAAWMPVLQIGKYCGLAVDLLDLWRPAAAQFIRLNEFGRLSCGSDGAGGRASLYLASPSLLMGLRVRVGSEDTVRKWPHRRPNRYCLRLAGLCHALYSLVSSPMPSIATVTVLTGSFMDPTPSDVPQQMMSPGSSVMSCEILLTSCCALKIMSDIGYD